MITLQQLVVSLCLAIGTIFIFFASVGIFRLPDLFLRMSAASKASTVGVAALVLAVALLFNKLTVSAQAGAIILFLMLTNPVGAHIIGRIAYYKKTVTLFPPTKDELADHQADQKAKAK